MKNLKPSNPDSYKTKILEENKQEIIHEDDNEDDDDSDDESDEDNDLDAVFGHKQATKKNISTGNSTKHCKKPSMGELKVNVQGPVRVGNNQVHQRVPLSATQPKIKGLGGPSSNINQNQFGHANQPYSPSYPNFQNNLMHQNQLLTNNEMTMNTINQQMMQQKHISHYHISQMYPSHQPHSAGLSRKPPGFEFMNPNPASMYPVYNPPQETVVPLKPGMMPYNEFQPSYMHPQTPYYPKQSASPLVPPSNNYDLSRLKKQPQSATMMPLGDKTAYTDSKNKLGKLGTAHADSQESKIFELIKK